ncbi:solute carrier family 35 member F2 isoform X2 [Danio aesculapii]|uniref:solute carrier family 35 member F2 isoform X2 n=1 Tax=Danio aesculapii TaxID=1142201 RepID=UPI0024BFE08A|nr:solute carrier family 35 member F2 isoform X2 [Danio aesculapii]
MPQEQLDTLCFKMREGLPKWRDVFTWQLLKILLMGQGLSALICGTAVTSQYLASVYYLNTPMLQSFINYTLLGITYTMALIFRRGDGNILQILKTKWWKYLLLAVADVEANYAVVKAYQYTTLTSIQTRYRIIHYAAVSICLAGVGAMVGADILAGQDQGSSSDVLLGDGLVLVSATLYAISNVCQEYTVKNLSRVEFLGMVGLFGSIISAIQLGILEHKEVANIQWTWEKALLLAGYALCMYGFYSFMPVVIKRSSATAVNLSLLTGDLFSLFFGLFLFHYNFSGLYIVSLVGILIGFIMFNTVPTLSRLSDPSSDEEGVDNHTADTDNNSIEGCEGEISGAQAEQRERPPACVVINSVKL